MEWLNLFGWIILVLAIIFFVKRLCKVLYVFHQIFWPFILGRPKDLKRLAGSDWAVVTGSTDGIGKAYSFELAKRGFNLVLISRSQQKLDTTAEEIHLQYPEIQIQTIAFDFTTSNVDDYERVIFSLLDNLPIGLLVNNVGTSYEYPEQAHKVHGGLNKLRDIVVVNTLSVTLMTARILNQMTQRNRGIIVNISSGAAFHPTTYWGIYSATKEYMRWLDCVLRKEYASTRIHFQTICPLLVKTKLSAVVEDFPEILAVTPETFARQAVRSIGLTNFTTGCLSHQFQYSIIYKLTPRWILDMGLKQSGEQNRKAGLARIQRGQAGPSIDSTAPLISS